MDRKTRIQNFIFCLGFTLVAALFVYPSFTDSLNNIFLTSAINDYRNSTYEMPDDEIAKIKDAAREYNEKIFEKQKKEPFYYQGELATDEEYESLLKPDPETNIMGYIEVPSADIYLPIAHGTKNEDLQYEAGHMYGSSLPVGGENTKAVIAGHTGLQRVDIFTNLTKVKVGDEFYVHVLDDIYVYNVRRIDVVWPEDEMPYMQIQKEKDIVLLYTCTPYGINDHRLLIQGLRTGTKSANSEGGKTQIVKKNVHAIIKMIVCAMIPFLVMLISIGLMIREAKRNNIV